MIRWLSVALLCCLPLAAEAQSFPSPTFQAASVIGSVSTGTLSVTGAANLKGGGVLAGTFTGPMILDTARTVATPYTIATLPTPIAMGDMVWVTDCLNGTQTFGHGTGCLYTVDNTNTWTPLPNVSTLTVTVGGQALSLSGNAVTTNQGNGPAIQLAGSVAGVPGQCVQFDSNLNIVPSGAACSSGGGGSGTVTAGTTNQLPYYAGAGTTLTAFGPVNNAVVVTSNTGLPSESTTLPTGLTIPSATLSNPTATGTMNAAVETLSGKLTTAASSAGGANLSIPQGTTPTTPGNGDVWATSAGLFGRFNGITTGPFIGLANLSATSPITYNNGTGAFACTTCATTTNGGALTATSPIAISVGGAISLGTTIGAAEFFTDASSAVHNDIYPLPVDTWPWASGTIDSVTYYTGGTSTPSFSIALQINGANVTSCNGITVNSATRATTTCSLANNTITSGQHPTLVISGTAGTPFSSLVQINYHHSNP
jgi:hypothetical protein